MRDIDVLEMKKCNMGKYSVSPAEFERISGRSGIIEISCQRGGGNWGIDEAAALRVRQIFIDHAISLVNAVKNELPQFYGDVGSISLYRESPDSPSSDESEWTVEVDYTRDRDGYR